MGLNSVNFDITLECSEMHPNCDYLGYLIAKIAG